MHIHMYVLCSARTFNEDMDASQFPFNIMCYFSSIHHPFLIDKDICEVVSCSPCPKLKFTTIKKLVYCRNYESIKLTLTLPFTS